MHPPIQSITIITLIIFFFFFKVSVRQEGQSSLGRQKASGGHMPQLKFIIFYFIWPPGRPKSDKRKRTIGHASSKPTRVIIGAGFVKTDDGKRKVSPFELSCVSVTDDVRHQFKGDMVLADYLCVNKRKGDDSLVTVTEQSAKLS